MLGLGIAVLGLGLRILVRLGNQDVFGVLGFGVQGLTRLLRFLLAV